MEIAPDDPYVQQFERCRRNTRPQLHSAQRGLVWQAEEVSGGGSVASLLWLRGTARDRPRAGGGGRFPRGVEHGWYRDLARPRGATVPPGGHDDGLSILVDPVPVGGPLPIVLSLRNHRGIAATAPTDLARPGGEPVLRDGVTIRVFLRQPDPAKQDPVAGNVAECAAAGAVAGGRAPTRAAHYRSEAVRTLQPTETAEVLRLDLRDLFDLDRPGRYLVEVALEDVRTEEGKPARISADFNLKPAGRVIAPRRTRSIVGGYRAERYTFWDAPAAVKAGQDRAEPGCPS